MNKLQIMQWLKKYGYLFIFFASIFGLEIVFRSAYIDFSFTPLFDLTPILFDLAWAFMFTLIAFILPGNWKKAYMIFIALLFGILFCAQSAYFNLFFKYFGVSDLSLAGEGMAFVDTSYIRITKRVLLMAVIVFALVAIAAYLAPKKQKLDWRIIAGTVVLFFGLYFGARNTLSPVQDASLWNASSSTGNIYEDFNDSTKSLMLTGGYEYTIRDIYLMYNPFKKLSNADTIDNLNHYFETTQETHTSNDMTAKFAGKNLMFIQLENLDQWMLTQDNMPILYDIRQNSLDFVNHYSASFSTGRTFNTEFMANTGFIPPTNGTAPSYIFSKNAYPYSLANVFNNHNYTSNSFHSANGNIYNRAAVHKQFGYDAYHNYEAMGMDDYTLDSQLINGYDVMTESDNPFLDFIITYSPHGPFDVELATCKNNLDYVETFANSEDITYVCGLAQARETELFVEELMNKMKEDGKLEETIFVFYTDHYAYGTIDTETEYALKGTNDVNLLSNTPFFIYAPGVEGTTQKIEKVTSTIDILPTIINLFFDDAEFKYYIGHDAFSEEGGYVYFQDGSIYDGETYYNPVKTENIDDELAGKIEESVVALKRSWDILETDYFKDLE